MTFSKNEINSNLIKRHSKIIILLSLLSLVLFLNITPISALEEQININNTIYDRIHQTIKPDDAVDKEELEKRKKLKACDLLIKVRLAQDMENVKDFIVNLIQSYSISKKDALTKLNSFLSLSCLYNIVPENIETIESSKSLLEIDSMKPELVKVLELEEWFELHKKLDTTRLQEKINFLRTQFNKYKKNKDEEVINKGIKIFGLDISSLSSEVKLAIMFAVFAILIGVFLYLFSKLNRERRVKKKKNN